MPTQTDIVPTKTRNVFFTRNAGLNLVRIGGDTEVFQNNRQREIHPGLRYTFDRDGYLVVDDKLRERDRNFFEQYWEVVGPGVGEEPAEEWLRNHDRFNVEHGFVEIEAKAPDAGPVLNQITDALVAGDEKKLVTIYEEEEATWGRSDVLEAAKHSLSKLEEQPREAPATQ